MDLVYSAGIVPVSSDNKYLLMRSKHYIDFPKGKLEEGESFLEAALRETKEESGLWDLDFEWGMEFLETDPYKTVVDGKKAMKVSRYYVARVKSGDVKILPNEETGIIEHDDFYWLSYDKAKRLPIPKRISMVLDWADRLVRV